MADAGAAPADAVRPSAGDELVFVALGSNLGDRDAHLAWARARIATLPDTVLVDASGVEETAPLPPHTGQPPYRNQMLALRTRLAPLALLDALLAVEQEAGRERPYRWAPRTLDCDVVAFGERRVRHPRLTLPHPGAAQRDFWRRERAELEARLGAGAGA